jgi:hypothetical protein
MLKNHAITADTPKNVLLGSGILVKDLVYAENDWTYEELGATSGGGKITYEREYLDLDVDGKKVKVEGFDVKLGETGTMTLNLAEVKPETIATALSLKQDTSSSITGLAKYKPSNENAYVDRLGFVGFKADGKPIIVIFPKAICLSALELEVKNKEQATMALDFSAVAPKDSANYDELGIEFYFPTETV